MYRFDLIVVLTFGTTFATFYILSCRKVKMTYGLY